MKTILKSYDAKLDSKNRLTIRKPQYEFYHAVEYEDGTIVLEPRKLIDPLIVSKKTLDMIDESMKNVKSGDVFGPVKH